MTKEEAISQYVKMSHADTFWLYAEDAKKAMDEYAKQFSEKLIGWLNDNDFKLTGFKDNMQSDYVNNGERMHASEIVDLFIEQQNK